MKRTLIIPRIDEYPSEFHGLLAASRVWDSSCSPEARVIYIDRDGGYYLKSAPKGSLAREAEMARYFHQKGLGAEVLSYLSLEQDWLLTSRVAGEDATHARYLEDPVRLCETTAGLLRRLHSLDFSDCPVQDRNASYCKTAEQNWRLGRFDQTLFPDGWGYRTKEDAWRAIEQGRGELKREVLLHGDYCLPNVMLNDWSFSGFIDLGNGGVGDRHIDLFWGAWTLNFNLKTDAYTDRFLDAYGRKDVDWEKLKLIAAFEMFG